MWEQVKWTFGFSNSCCAPTHIVSSDSISITGSVAAPSVGGPLDSFGVVHAVSDGTLEHVYLKPVTEQRKASSLMCTTKSLESTGFLEEFVLTDILGQGSFSIVLACKARSAKDDGRYAVKLIEKVDARPEDIERETALHMKLSHPNILMLHRVFWEKCFVCMIVDLFEGGSLVEYLQKNREVLSGRILHIGRQMVQAIDYLHGKSIMHRDVKADNFLSSCRDLMDKRCRVVLADFGFACNCELGDRLKRQCGTQRYWSPEVWDKNYALKADVWALGVTFHGVVESSFPFLCEFEVKHKEISLCRVVSPRLADFIKQLLCKKEFNRLSAAEALQHPWISQQQEGAEEQELEVQGSLRTDLEALAPELPDAATAERRLELVERFASAVPSKTCGEHSFSIDASQGSFDSEGATPMSILSMNSFSVSDKRACKTRTFEWWSGRKVEQRGLLSIGDGMTFSAASSNNSSQAASSVADLGVQTQILAQMLEEFGVDTSRFGKGDAKTLERFADEVQGGFSCLMLDASMHRALVRVVEVVLLRLCIVSGGEERFMIVSADEQPDGRVRGDLNRLPGTKKLPHENVRNAALRTLSEIPDLNGAKVSFDFDHTEVFEVEEESPSYPGVRTVYRKEIVAGQVRGSAAACGAGVRGGTRSTKYLSWWTEEECHLKRVTLTAPVSGSEVSCLVPAPLGLKIEALGRFLESHSVDPSMFGKNGAKTLQELSDELQTGESSLTCLRSGRLARIVDVVVLKLVLAGTSDILVVAKEVAADGKGSSDEVLRGRLPGSKRRPDENQFNAARRVLRRQLNVSENMVNFDPSGVFIVEEGKDSPSYPGLHTVYRRRIIPASLDVMQPSSQGPLSRQISSYKVPDIIMEEPACGKNGSSASAASDARPAPRGGSVVSLLKRNVSTFSRKLFPEKKKKSSTKL